MEERLGIIVVLVEDLLEKLNFFIVGYVSVMYMLGRVDKGFVKILRLDDEIQKIFNNSWEL